MSEISKLYGAKPEETLPFSPNHNVHPDLNMPVVIECEKNKRIIASYNWGLIPFWAKEVNTGYSMINARAESLKTKRSYEKPFRLQRCIVPANGFYEWKKNTEGKKTPYYITLPDERLMSFAGLYEHWKGPDNQSLDSFTIITTDANSMIQPLHDRMPAILLSEEMDMWLDPDNQDTELIQGLLHPYPDDDIKLYPVSTAVNNPKNQDPSLIEPDQNLFS